MQTIFQNSNCVRCALLKWIDVLKYDIPSLRFTTILHKTIESACICVKCVWRVCVCVYIYCIVHSFGFVFAPFWSFNRIILWPVLTSNIIQWTAISWHLLSSKIQPHTVITFSLLPLSRLCVCDGGLDNNRQRKTKLFVFFDHIILMAILWVRAYVFVCKSVAEGWQSRNRKFEGKWWIIKPSTHFPQKTK